MNFYADANGLFHLGDSIVSTSTCTMKTSSNGTVVSVYSTEGNLVLPNNAVTELKKEDGSTYADIDELLTAVQGFF